MKHKISYIFHCKNIKTPLIWALFDEIKYDYGYFIHFLRYRMDFDYYVGFSGKDYNYKKLLYHTFSCAFGSRHNCLQIKTEG